MDPYANTQIGLDGKRHPIGDPALHVHPNRPDANPPVVFDPAEDHGQPLGPGEMADPRVSPAEIANVASGMPIATNVEPPEPEAGQERVVGPGQYDPRLYPAATTAHEAQMIADARDAEPDAYPAPAGLEPDVPDDGNADTEPAAEPDGDDDDDDETLEETVKALVKTAEERDTAQAAAEQLGEQLTAVREEAEAAKQASDEEIAQLRAELEEARKAPVEPVASEQTSEETEGNADTQPEPQPQLDVSKLTGPQLDAEAAKLDPPVKLTGTVKEKREQLAAALAPSA